MNREVGFGRKLLHILEDYDVSYEHTPSGIDDISVIVRQKQLDGGTEEQIVQRIKDELQADSVTVKRDLAMVMIVGEGMQQKHRNNSKKQQQLFQRLA
ncbi:hypothetical protein GCM10020331_076870 [Ectobacillus funiculus]